MVSNSKETQEQKIKHFDVFQAMKHQFKGEGASAAKPEMFDDRLNSSGSNATDTGSEQVAPKQDFVGGPGGWDFTEYMHNKTEIDIDITSVDIFSLARHGRLKELNAILAHGVDPNSKDKHGNTVLIVGAQNGNKAVIKAALRHGAHLNMTNTMGNSALHFASEFKFDRVRSYLL